MKFARINATTDGDNEIVAANTVPEDRRIRVLNYSVTANSAGVVTFQDTASSAGIVASFELTDSGSHTFNGTRESPAFDLNHPEAGIPVGIGIGEIKDAPEAPVYDQTDDKVK